MSARLAVRRLFSSDRSDHTCIRYQHHALIANLSGPITDVLRT